jgi:DNA primase small subunit
MDGRTREYLRGRFGDHYRRTAVAPPPAGNEREWGYITWSGGGTTMVRHRSLIDLIGGGSLSAFLGEERPRHVYFSAGRYDDPGADGMGAKGWRGSDLIFDLDGDHLPGVDPETTGYGEMLAECKEALARLLDLLESDFGFDEHTIVFSGGRGYHVHVRDEGVQALDRGARGEIADYLLGEGLEFDDIVRTETVAGSAGRSSPADKRTLPDGGWAGRTRDRLEGFVDELLELPDEQAVERLQSYEGIGEGKASAALRAARENREALADGNVDLHSAVYTVARRLFEEVLAAEAAPIDEPVTTDVNRLIRLPGSLHGGSGLAVRRIGRADVPSFDPLVDAVPETFVGNRIDVSVEEATVVELGGETFRLEPGVHTVPEYVGVFAMARGHAAKTPE